MRSLQILNMTNPAFKPTIGLRRLEDVTATASARISKLEADVEWYKHVLEEKHAWAKSAEERAEVAETDLWVWRTFALGLAVGLILTIVAYRATELSFR